MMRVPRGTPTIRASIRVFMCPRACLRAIQIPTKVITSSRAAETTTVRTMRPPIGALGNSWFTVAMAGRARAPLGVERACVEDGLRLGLAAEDDQEVGHHCGLPLLIQLDDSLLGELPQRHLDHADGAEHDLLARGDHRLGLLAAEHRLGDLRGVREVRQAGLLDAYPGPGKAVLGLLG